MRFNIFHFISFFCDFSLLLKIFDKTLNLFRFLKLSQKFRVKSFINSMKVYNLLKRTLVTMEGENQLQNQVLKDFDQQYRIPFEQSNIWKQYLKDNGFVVVKNFVSKQTCSKFMDQVWEAMEKLSLGKLKRKDVQTQKIADNYPSSHRGGLMQYIGHAHFQWELRKLAKPIYQELWETQDVKCSFDGVNFSNGLLNFPFAPENQGLHVDQPPIKNKLWSYQGIMALTDAGDNGGGFVCVPKSHLYFSQYFKDRQMQGRIKAYSIPEEDRYKEPLCNYIKVNVEAGDFMIFDSRTFHCGCPPSNQNLRVVTYICMMPTNMIPQKVKEQRLKAFQDRINSGHHCGDGFRTFAKTPRTAPKDHNELTQFQKVRDEINQVDNNNLEKDENVMQLV